MLDLNGLIEELYKKLKPYEDSAVPLFPNSVRIPGGSRNLQKMLDLLDDLPKLSVEDPQIKRIELSQFVGLREKASGASKKTVAEYLSQWGIEFEYKVSISCGFYGALVKYVNEHGFVKDKID